MGKTIQTTVMEIEDLKGIGITGATDAALIMGAWQSTKTKDSAGRLSCRLYSATGDHNGRIGILETDGESITCACDSRFVAVRPSLRASDFSVLDEEGQSGVLPTADNPVTLKIDKAEVELSVDPQGRYVFYYGVFPQVIAPPEVAQKLETMKKETPKRFYHINPSKLDNSSNLRAEEWEHGEYVLDDRRYVRMTASDSGQILSNGEKVVAGNHYWCEVRPIQWIYDPKGQRAYSDLALFAGIPWETKEDAPKWLFKKEDKKDPFLGCGLEDYLTIIFSEDMMSSYASCMKQEQKRAFNLDEWLKKNPNPQAKDLFKRPFWKQGKRVIDLILENGNEAVIKAFPAEKWIDPKRRSTLQEIFSGVELTQENKLLLIRLETRLRKAMVAHLRQQSAGKIKKPDKTL